MLTINDLQITIEQNLEDIANDPLLCETYVNVCRYITVPENKAKVIEKVTKLVVKEGITDLFAAIALVNDQLYEGEN